MSDLIARLEAMRDVHEPVTRRYRDQDGNPYTVTSCQTCNPFDEPHCETYLLLSVAIAAERRRQAEDEMRQREVEFTSEGWVEWRYREGVADKELHAALAALDAHLKTGQRTEDDR